MCSNSQLWSQTQQQSDWHCLLWRKQFNALHSFLLVISGKKLCSSASWNDTPYWSPIFGLQFLRSLHLPLTSFWSPLILSYQDVPYLAVKATEKQKYAEFLAYEILGKFTFQKPIVAADTIEETMYEYALFQYSLSRGSFSSAKHFLGRQSPPS